MTTTTMQTLPGDGARHAARDNAVFSGIEAFENAQRMAKALTASDLVPDTYKGNIANALIALEIANRIGCSPLMVMQNLYIVHGRPSWSSTFIVAAINASGRFKPLRFVLEGEGDDKGCYAWTTDQDGERLEGTRVTIGMAKAEGWTARKGSKWLTMPELMLRYRAATFFGRLYAPEILMGMRPADESEDIESAKSAERAPKPKPQAAAITIEHQAVEAEGTVSLEDVNRFWDRAETHKVSASQVATLCADNDLPASPAFMTLDQLRLLDSLMTGLAQNDLEDATDAEWSEVVDALPVTDAPRAIKEPAKKGKKADAAPDPAAAMAGALPADQEPTVPWEDPTAWEDGEAV